MFLSFYYNLTQVSLSVSSSQNSGSQALFLRTIRVSDQGLNKISLLPSPSSIYPSTECEVSDVSIPPPSFDLTDIRSCELVINNESFQDILVVTTDTDNSR